MTYDELNSNMIDSSEMIGKNLDLSFIMWKQIDTIRNIASREFHKSILLFNDSGSARNYLPDVMESYCNAIENLEILLWPYLDKEYEKAKNSISKDDKLKYFKEIYKECLMQLKRMKLLPKKHIVAERIQPRKYKEQVKNEDC